MTVLRRASPGRHWTGPCNNAPHSPELNPVERVWLFLRERHLSHRLLAGYDAIVDALCTAWKQLTPERLNTLTSNPYLNQVKI